MLRLTMFQRRLLLLAGAIAAGFLVLSVQLGRLTLAQGERWLEAAEAALLAERWTPTYRGRVLDRKGRVLAEDQPAYDILVDYPLISGEWALVEAERRARRAAGENWSTLGPEDRERLIREDLAAAEADLEDLWALLAVTAGVELEEVQATRNEIVSRVQRMGGYLRAKWLNQQRAQFEIRGRGSAPTLADVAEPIEEQVSPHVVIENVNESVAFAVRRMSQALPGLSVQPTGERMYPYETVSVVIDRSSFPAPMRDEGSEPQLTVEVEGVATHLIGWMGQAQREHVEARPVYLENGEIDRGGYLANDPVGAAGIEAGYETTLRGKRGRRSWRKDIDQTKTIAAEPGRDVQLTIDIALQARIAALLEPEVGLAMVQPWQKQPKPEVQPVGTPLPGAAVVLEVESGEILAMVTSPSFTRERMAEDPEWVFFNRAESPITARATEKPYPPGSVVKPVVLVSAVTAGVHSLGHHIECTGHLLERHPDAYRCWIYKTYGITHHGAHGGGLSAPEAISWSCNIYFYTLGRALGGERLQEWFHRFGVGDTFGLKVGHEFPGWLGRQGGTAPIQLNEATMMGIGQGPIAWTPLHAANAYATLAREGLRITPRLVQTEPPVMQDLQLNQAAVDAAMEGLRRAVLDEYGGTTASVDWGNGQREPLVAMDGVTVWGKSGTAQAPSIFAPALDEASEISELLEPADGEASARRADPPKRELLRAGDHSWFVMLVGPEGQGPRYAVAVVVEYGGSGSRVAGPIANQILRALRAEGYL